MDMFDILALGLDIDSMAIEEENPCRRCAQGTHPRRKASLAASAFLPTIVRHKLLPTENVAWFSPGFYLSL
jgi:hypothetical protein